MSGSDPFKAMMMISWEGGNRVLDLRKNSLNRRLILFRWTAPPLFFPTANPSRARPRGLGFIMTRKWGKVFFRAVEDFRIKSLCFNILSVLGKEEDFIRSNTGNTCKAYTANLFLPLALLRLMTCRPPGELIRTKKPWVRDRFKLLGWKVLFINTTSPRLKINLT